MHIGIDLGTSNSAVAGYVGAEPRVFKTTDGADVLPSVIYIDKRGHKLLGQRAYNQSVLSPDNTASGFKRLMGTSSLIEFSASGQHMSPEECSAEVIRQLLGQAYTESGSDTVTGAVVTIPAAFNQLQSEATLRSAAAAGLARTALLQEPIAAAMAAMAKAKSKRGQFLVYDLGGGTFDLALVQSVAGSVNVIAHEGINMLGGRDFDRLIVNAMVRPWLADQFSLPEDFQKKPRYRKLTGLCRLAAEKAKIGLSAIERETIFASEDEVRVADEAGNEVYLNVEINRSDLESLIEEPVEETLGLARKLLKDNGYSHEDIDRVVFVGGPSKTPYIRDHVSRELGIPADLHGDPMTAVAVGAAIYCESRDWGSAETTRKATRASVRSDGDLDITYDFPARVADDRARVRIRVGDEQVTEGYEFQVDSNKGWTSGRKSLESGLSIEVPVDEHGENPFRITVLDASGRPVPSGTKTIVITRTQASAAGIPATQTISVKVVDGAGDSQRNVLEPIIEKGTLLPETGTARLRAARQLQAGEDGHIDLELYQQRLAEVGEPELNLFIGCFRVKGEDLSPGMTIRKGDEVICNWAMNDSGILRVAIEIPAVGQTFDTGNLYADTAGHRSFEGEDGDQLARAVLADASADLGELKEDLGEAAPSELEDLERRLERQAERLEQETAAEERRAVTEDARFIRQEAARVRNAPGNRARKLRREHAGLTASFDQECRASADATRTARFDQLANSMEQLTSRGDDNALGDAERVLRQMRRIHLQELFQQPGYIIWLFKTLAEERYLAIDRELFDRHASEGRRAVEGNDISRLREIIRAMFQNRFEVGGGDRAVAEVAHLMRA